MTDAELDWHANLYQWAHRPPGPMSTQAYIQFLEDTYPEKQRQINEYEHVAHFERIAKQSRTFERYLELATTFLRFYSPHPPRP